jgi:hypothetical protein
VELIPRVKEDMFFDAIFRVSWNGQRNEHSYTFCLIGIQNDGNPSIRHDVDAEKADMENIRQPK